MQFSTFSLPKTLTNYVRYTTNSTAPSNYQYAGEDYGKSHCIMKAALVLVNAGSYVHF